MWALRTQLQATSARPVAFPGRQHSESLWRVSTPRMDSLVDGGYSNRLWDLGPGFHPVLGLRFLRLVANGVHGGKGGA